MDRKSGYIMLSVAAGALLAGVIDAVVRPGYLVKSLLKLALFFLLPMAFFLRRREEREAFRALFLFQKKGLLRGMPGLPLPAASGLLPGPGTRGQPARSED